MALQRLFLCTEQCNAVFFCTHLNPIEAILKHCLFGESLVPNFAI